jgi:hypothetical protein
VDAIAPVTAALLVPVLVGFALEVPADAIDRIASPFIGQASAAVVTRKTHDDDLRRAVRTSMAPQLYPAGIVTAPRKRLPAAVAAPTSSVPRARRILPLDEWASGPTSAPPRADEPAPTTAVRRPRRAPLPDDEEVPVQPDRGSVPATDEPVGGTAPRTTPPAPDTGTGRADGGASPGPAAPDGGGGAGGGEEPIAGDGGEGDPGVTPPAEPPPADGPGNSENAPGHVEGGPGNSENAPGQAKKDKEGA